MSEHAGWLALALWLYRAWFLGRGGKPNYLWSLHFYHLRTTLLEELGVPPWPETDAEHFSRTVALLVAWQTGTHGTGASSLCLCSALASSVARGALLSIPRPCASGLG